MSVNDIYEFGYPENKRIQTINENQAKTLEYYQIEYKGKYRKLPIVELNIGVPVYRIENIRTKNLQKEWIATHPEVPSDIFVNDPDSIEAQENQHQILLTLVNKEKLLDTFSDGITKQTLPIIITDNGIVVNGNRRLAAWRKLFYEKPDKFKHFQTVNCAVLPDHDPSAVYDLEVDLQIAPEMKAQYAWHAIAADLKEKMDLNNDPEAIGKRQKLKADEVIRYVSCYELAQEYLESSGHPNEWSLVDDKEYAFKQIVKSRSSIKNPGDKELFIKLSNSTLGVKAEGGRLYELIPNIAKNINDIANDLIEKFDIDVEKKDDINPLLINLDSDDEDLKKAKLANSLNDISDEDIIKEVRKVISINDEIEKEKKNKTFVFDQVVKAASNLSHAIENLQDSMQKDGISKQLDNIDDFVKILRDWIK